MKSILIITMLFSCQKIAQAQTGSIILMVEGIDVKKGGELSVGIFQQSSFPKVGRQLIGKEVKVQAASMQIHFAEVPPGTYGVAVFQDIDRNKDLKTNFIGLPQEPIGFSNDARISFGPPSFDNAKFTVESDKEIKLKITLR